VEALGVMPRIQTHARDRQKQKTPAQTHRSERKHKEIREQSRRQQTPKHISSPRPPTKINLTKHAVPTSAKCREENPHQHHLATAQPTRSRLNTQNDAGKQAIPPDGSPKLGSAAEAAAFRLIVRTRGKDARALDAEAGTQGRSKKAKDGP